MGGVLPSAHTGVPLVPHWRGCVAVFPVCIRTIFVTCTRTVPVTRTVPIAALHQCPYDRCTNAAPPHHQHRTNSVPPHHTNNISRGSTLYFVYVYLKKCCSFAQKTPARDTSRKKFGKVLAKQIPLCIIPSYKFFDENTTFRLLCYSESGMVKADRASANRYHL